VPRSSAVPLKRMRRLHLSKEDLDTHLCAKRDPDPEQRRQKCRTPFGLTKKLLGIHSDMASPAGEANLDLSHLNAAGLP